MSVLAQQLCLRASTELLGPCKHVAGGNPCPWDSTGQACSVSIAKCCTATGVSLQSKAVGVQVYILHGRANSTLALA